MPSNTYNFTGGWVTFNVPKGVKSVTVDVKGGGAGAVAAGRVAGKVAVTGDTVLWINVGEAGKARSGDTGGDPSHGGGGGGGNGHGAGSGGYGGGGASYIRKNSTTGTIVCVAAGAGGASGAGGNGGQGGATTGENGFPGGTGSADVGNATGGTPIQGGNGGTSALGTDYYGTSAENSALSHGGAGGQAPFNDTHGGGGGGGGWHGGGGGQAGLIGTAMSGGGAGGANYTAGLTQDQTERGGGGTGNGVIILTWVSPAPANQPPSPPSNIKVNGKAEQDGMATQSTGDIKITAELNDPDGAQKDSSGPGDTSQNADRVRMVIQTSVHSNFSSFWTRQSDLVDRGKRAEINFSGLSMNTRYYMRVWAEDNHGLRSLTYNGVNFWTNRSPLPPSLTAPASNTTVDTIDSVVFTWDHRDPDPGDAQSAFELRWRRSAIPTRGAGDWSSHSRDTAFESFTADPNTFKANRFYDWTVRTKDSRLWGPWAPILRFFVSGLTEAPTLRSPIRDVATDVDSTVTFKWLFNDPTLSGDAQTRADLRYRKQGTQVWVNVLGDIVTPGALHRWTLPMGLFEPGFGYEWSVRTYGIAGPPSDWADEEQFRAIHTPGASGGLAFPELFEVAESLGCGSHRVFVYDQGGQVMRGEITPMTQVMWNRKRDDISNCLVTTNGYGTDCGDLLAELRSWIHELVVFRDGERVFEGPITRITYKADQVEIEAKDVMAYVYRRILRQGFNDSFRVVDGEEEGLPTVVERAGQIIMNALSYADPNVLPYLTTLTNPGDARTSRVILDYSKTAWEEVDDLAATAGLDYTTVGRRILLWDTHRAIGRLAEMRDGDFSDPPVVTEYGMNLANYYAVTNNNGVWGAAIAEAGFKFYGPIEHLASAYGEAEGDPTQNLSPEATEKLREALRSQAERNIAHRWPTPLLVRVPDNSALNPEVHLGINQLIPGVFIPLRSTSTVRQVAQWQKLDSMQVTEVNGDEKITVVMSPAPSGGADPDSDPGPGAEQ